VGGGRGGSYIALSGGELREGEKKRELAKRGRNVQG